MLQYGLVENKDGKYEYNVAAYKAKKDYKEDLVDKLNSGEINYQQYKEAIEKGPESLPEYNPEEVEKNSYKKRIQTIIDARRENQALDWMLNDIVSGDGVSRLAEELIKEEDKQARSDEAKTKARQQQQGFSFETSEPQQQKQQSQERVQQIKQKYHPRKKGTSSVRKL